MHWQDRPAVPQDHPDVATLCRFEACSLPFKPPLELRAGHKVNIYVHQVCGKASVSIPGTYRSSTVPTHAGARVARPPVVVDDASPYWCRGKSVLDDDREANRSDENAEASKL